MKITKQLRAATQRKRYATEVLPGIISVWRLFDITMENMFKENIMMIVIMTIVDVMIVVVIIIW